MILSNLANKASLLYLTNTSCANSEWSLRSLPSNCGPVFTSAVVVWHYSREVLRHSI